MSFENPYALIALVAVPVALAAYVLWERRRAQAAAQFASPALYPGVVARAPGPVRHLPAALFLIALAALTVGFARPHAMLSVPREDATIVLAIDRSRSMVATDVQPSRLVAAQRAAKTFIDEVPASFKIGLVTFSTQAQVAAPPSIDRDLVRRAIDSIQTGEGTALGEAIVVALDSGRGVPIGTPPVRRPDDPPLAVVLLSDGANTQGRITPERAVRNARALQVPVYTVGLGTQAGVVERRLPNGLTERIRVPPDLRTLSAIAETTGAETFAVANAQRLRTVYEDLGSRLGHRDERKEITYAFALGGAALLIAAGAASVLLLHRLP